MRVPGSVKRVFDTFPLSSLPNIHSAPDTPTLFVNGCGENGLSLDPKSLEAQLWARIHSGKDFTIVHASCEASADKRLPVASGMVLGNFTIQSDRAMHQVYATMAHTALWPLWISTVFETSSTNNDNKDWFTSIYVYEHDKLPKILVERLASKIAYSYFHDLLAEYPGLRPAKNQYLLPRSNFDRAYVDDTTRDQIWAKAKVCLDALDTILEASYFSSTDAPSELDWIVFSYIYPILVVGNDPARALVPQSIRDHCDRIHMYISG